MKNILKILGNRVAVRPIDKPLSETISIPDTIDQRDRHFEAEIVMVGEKLTDDLAVGDRVVIERRGEQPVICNGKPALLVSVKAVVARLLMFLLVASCYGETNGWRSWPGWKFAGSDLFVCGITNSLANTTNSGRLCATLNWEVDIKWRQPYQSMTLEYPPSQNIVYYEYGIISSNLIAVFEWKGQANRVVLETIKIGETNRSYTVREVRDYK